MTSKADFTVSPDAHKITRTAAIAMLNGMRAKAATSRFGNGQLFSVRWVAIGDQKSGPYICRKVARFQVQKNLTGRGMSYNPQDQGYMVIYAMVNGATALKRYREQAQHRLEELSPTVPGVQRELAEALAAHAAAEATAQQAAAALTAVEQMEYPSKAARERAEVPLRAPKRDADRAVKTASTAVERAQRKADRLIAKIQKEQLKTTDPLQAITNGLNESIAKRLAKLETETDGDKRTDIEQKIAREREWLEDPVQALMSTYCILNLNGLLWLKINKKEYEVTTPPVPAIPADPVEEGEEDAPIVALTPPAEETAA